MTLDEAIEILKREANLCDPDMEHSFHDALHLGIEALKRCQAYRNPRLYKFTYLVPGETERS